MSKKVEFKEYKEGNNDNVKDWKDGEDGEKKIWIRMQRRMGRRGGGILGRK